MVYFDREHIVCVNVRSHSQKQLFAISERYGLNFEVLVELKGMATNLPGQFTGKIWLDSRLDVMLASEFKSNYDLVENPDGDGYVKVYRNEKMIFIEDAAAEMFYSPIGEEEKEILRGIPQIKATKAKKDSMERYVYYLSKGYDINMVSFDRFLSGERKITRPHENMSIKRLGKLMEDAVRREDYELAAELRDRISVMK